MLAAAVRTTTESAFRPDLLMNLVFLLAAVQLPRRRDRFDRPCRSAMTCWSIYQAEPVD